MPVWRHETQYGGDLQQIRRGTMTSETRGHSMKSQEGGEAEQLSAPSECHSVNLGLVDGFYLIYV